MTKIKAIAFYTYLPPWRIDVFNEMGKYYDLVLCFLNAETAGFTYNRELLLKKLYVKSIFMNNGFNIGSKPIRFGLTKILKTHKPEVVFSHEYSPTSFFLSFLLSIKFFNYKLIITTSDNLEMAKNVSGLKKYIRTFVLNNSYGIVVYSSKVKSWYNTHFPKLRIEICPNIQNPNTLLSYKKEFPSISLQHQKQFKINKPIVLFVGRLESEKGVNLLINAFSNSLSKTHLLVIVGDGSQKDSLINLTKEKGVENNVIFTGSFDAAKLYAWYRMAHFFVLPSTYEPFGAVVNEALVFGCPVLASNKIGALDYINEGVNGFIFNPLDSNDFENKLLICTERFTNDSRNRQSLMTFNFEDYVVKFKDIIS